MVKLRVKELMAAANAVIDTVAVHDALGWLDDANVVFVDLRDAAERAKAGEIPGAVHAPRGLLEFYADPETGIHNPVFASGKRLVVFCATGGRSTLAAKTLVDMGVPNVVNLAGGFAAWREAGGRVVCS
jgi:rhodanese-related sulfurtransferase